MFCLFMFLIVFIVSIYKCWLGALQSQGRELGMIWTRGLGLNESGEKPCKSIGVSQVLGQSAWHLCCWATYFILLLLGPCLFVLDIPVLGWGMIVYLSFSLLSSVCLSILSRNISFLRVNFIHIFIYSQTLICCCCCC